MRVHMGGQQPKALLDPDGQQGGQAPGGPRIGSSSEREADAEVELEAGG